TIRRYGFHSHFDLARGRRSVNEGRWAWSGRTTGGDRTGIGRRSAETDAGWTAAEKSPLALVESRGPRSGSTADDICSPRLDARCASGAYPCDLHCGQLL